MIKELDWYLRHRPVVHRTALIDGDVVVYRCGFAAQKNDKVDSEEEVAKAVDFTLESIRTGAMADNYRVYLTGDGNFREKVATIKPYKGNRAGNEKPVHYNFIRSLLVERFGALVVSGIEADDALGKDQSRDFQSVNGESSRCSTVICSIDKDLRMIPGWHYNWSKPNEEGEVGVLDWVDCWSAIRSFYYQLLVGDTVDNIPGCPGIGPKKAEKLFEKAQTEMDLYLACVEAYADKVPDAAGDHLLENATLLWIQQHGNETWQPPTGRG